MLSEPSSKDKSKKSLYKNLKIASAVVLTILSLCVILWLLQCLLMPKYMSELKEGALIAEYYDETTTHDVIFVGDCEVYENISPITLWEKYGITSYIRGSAQQLIWQSYYILEDTFEIEKPDIVIYNVQSMIYDEPQSEAYNRMTLDGMRFSSSKVKAIKASMTEDESFLSYIFPLLRYHSRWSDLSSEDIKYMFNKDKVSHNGYLMQTAIRPMTKLPEKPIFENYLSKKAFDYLDKMASLCEKNGAKLILVKSPSQYPYWHNEWNEQVEKYAEENGLDYYNFLDEVEEIGIDWQTDTYDYGLHLNVYGAEKYTEYLGNVLVEKYGAEGIFDNGQDKGIIDVWNKKIVAYYEEMARLEKEAANSTENENDINLIDRKNRYNEHPHDGFYYEVEGVKIGVDSGAWLLDVINEKGVTYTYSEAQSCAYQGLDMFYIFDSFDVTVNTIDGHNVIVSIRIKDDLTKTQEGLKISDGFDTMVDIYSDEYEKMGESYIYSKDGTKLSVRIENNMVNDINYSK